ncbi:MAG: hypothetical protein JXR58_12175 [Bacteroidales bacterium]|nr:hypothetical protein [Bacteroidales bacterium]
MKKLNLKSAISVLMVAAFLVLSSTGCKKKDEPAPIIPGVETFKINFSEFGTASDTTGGTKDVLSYQNWGHSFANVAVWNVIISVGLAVPVAAFNAALTQEAEYYHDGEYWIWDYNFNAGGLHRAELKGYLEGDSVVWEMRIDDFLWYYGKSHTARTGGYWILNESKTVPTQLLRIAWSNVDGTPYISYTNIAPTTSTHGAENGGYVSYGVETGEFDRFYNIYNKGQDNLIEIEWNSVDKHGHVKDSNKFGDNIWHCWNTALLDIICE